MGSAVDLETYRKSKKKQKELKRGNVRRASTVGYIDPMDGGSRKESSRRGKTRHMSMSHGAKPLVNLEKMLQMKDDRSRNETSDSKRRIIRRQKRDEKDTSSKKKDQRSSESKNKTRIPIKRK